MPTPLPPETDRSLLERIDVSVDRFESQLKSGDHPQIESFFEGWHDPELSNLLRELLGVELEYRVRRGEKVALVEYHNRFPRYRDVVDEEFPARLGNYDLLELVGLGAFGRVYRGRLRGTNICHAVKILHKGASSADFDSVAKEFQALAKIKHPAIVTAHNIDIGVGGAPAFLAMEYVEGKSLQDLLKSARLPVERVAQVVSEIAQALGAAHAAGIIHRDLKPANVLIDPEWHPHLTDFGLALLHVQRHDRTEELAGTLVYISPEQIRGEVCDPRSDIWSLGVIFYEMLTGETPFHGATRKVLFEQIQSAEPTEPRVLRPDLPPKLQQICLRCLEKDRTRRWATAYDLAGALQKFVRVQQGPRVHKLVAPLAVFAALVVIAVGLWFYLSHPSGSGKSDSDIFFAIESDLDNDPVLQNANIRIAVRNAAVTLTGDVRQEIDRMRAGAIAGQEAGVRRVTNNLRVAPVSLAAKVPGHLPQAPTASLESNLQSLPAHAPAKGMVLLPLNWMSVNALQQVGAELFLGGHGNNGGTLGKYEIGSGEFSDLSYLLPKPWCPVSALAYGANQLFIGGGSRGGCAGLLSRTSGSFQDMTPQLRAQSSDLYYYGGVGAVSFNGRDFLVGGSGKRTSLELYSPETRRFTYLGLGPYFAVNTIASDGNSFLIAGAGPGPGPQQPPAVGWISPAHTFTSLTATLPTNWGTTRRSAYDGKDFLIVGVDGISGTNQVLALINPMGTVTDVTNSFPAALNVHAIDGHDGYFLVAGQLEQKAYLARYRAGARLTTLTDVLPEGASDVTAVKIVGDKVVAAGVSRVGQLFIVVLEQPHDLR
jgi:serine/threonine protein kinase